MPSKLNTLAPVPATLDTVTSAYAGGSFAPDALRHSTVVPEVHAAVPHTPVPSTAVGDRFADEKLRPESVTLIAAEAITLALAALDTTGADVLVA